MTILLVDDEHSVLMLTGDFLSDQGWTVVTAENGEEALEKLAQTPFDLIISDVYMPVMDGLKFHKAVREHPDFWSIPFLFVSAYDDAYTLSIVSVSKQDAFLKKGRSHAELKEWVVYLTTPVERRGAPPSVSSLLKGERAAGKLSTREDRTTPRDGGRTR